MDTPNDIRLERMLPAYIGTTPAVIKHDAGTSLAPTDGSSAIGI